MGRLMGEIMSLPMLPMKIDHASIFLYKKSTTGCRIHTDLCLFLGTHDQMKRPLSILLRAVKIFLLLAIPRPQSSHTFLSKFTTNSFWFLSLSASKPLRILTEPFEEMNLGAPGHALGIILYLTWTETLRCNGKSPTEDNKVLSLPRDGVRRGFCVSVLSSLVFWNIYYALLL